MYSRACCRQGQSREWYNSLAHAWCDVIYLHMWVLHEMEFTVCFVFRGNGENAVRTNILYVCVWKWNEGKSSVLQKQCVNKLLVCTISSVTNLWGEKMYVAQYLPLLMKYSYMYVQCRYICTFKEFLMSSREMWFAYFMLSRRSFWHVINMKNNWGYFWGPQAASKELMLQVLKLCGK